VTLIRDLAVRLQHAAPIGELGLLHLRTGDLDVIGAAADW
jgi:hypothetical protein